jgi:hypothetical protein
LRPVRRLREGWHSPHARRIRAGAVRRLRSTSTQAQRLGRYIARRKWTLRVRYWARAGRDWLTRWWRSATGRAADVRYGRLAGWELKVAAAAIGLIGARRKKALPSPPLIGRIIGTAAPVPGRGGIPMPGRVLAAITAGEGEEPPLATEVERVREAASELKQALEALGGADISMLAYEQGLKELESVFEGLADGMKEMGSRADDEQPLAPEVTEFFDVIGEAVRGSAEVAAEMPGLFRAAHEVELARFEAPRRNEQKWDISANQD